MSDEPKSHIFFALLNHPLVKTWMNNTLSPASREAKRQDLTNFISWFKIKSMEDIQTINRDDIIKWRDAMLGPKDDQRYAILELLNVTWQPYPNSLKCSAITKSLRTTLSKGSNGLTLTPPRVQQPSYLCDGFDFLFPFLELRGFIEIVVTVIAVVCVKPLLIIAAVQSHIAQAGSDMLRRSKRLSKPWLIDVAEADIVAQKMFPESQAGSSSRGAPRPRADTR